MKKPLKGYIRKAEEKKDPTLADGVGSVAILLDDLRTVKKELVDEVSNKIDEADTLIKNVVETVDEKVKEVESFVEEATEVIADLKAEALDTIKEIKTGEPGKDADEELIVERILSRIPKLDEEGLIVRAVSRVPATKIDEDGMFKRFIKKMPDHKADLKIIREHFETDPMSVIDKILEMMESGKLKFKTKHIDGLEQTMSAFWNQIGRRGYLHGGGGTGGGGTPGGSDTQVQFNDGGTFGGDAGFTYNKTLDTATIVKLTLTGLVGGTIADTPLAINSSNAVVSAVTTGSGAIVLEEAGIISNAVAINSFTIPSAAAPTVNSDGEIAFDTTVADFSTGILKFYGNEEQGIVSMPIAQFGSPTNNFVIVYDSTADEFQLKSAASVSGLIIDTTPITSGGANRVLFENASNILDNSANFTYTDSTKQLLLIGTGLTTGIHFQTKNSAGTDRFSIADNGRVHIEVNGGDTFIGALGPEVYAVISKGGFGTSKVNFESVMDIYDNNGTLAMRFSNSSWTAIEFKTYIGDSNTAATALLHLGTAVSTTAGTAQLKMALGGTLMTAPEAGAIEAINTHIYWTDSAGTRFQLDQQSGSLAYVEQTGTTQAMAVNTRYTLNNAALVTATLPSTATVGDIIWVVGKGAGGWRIAQNASQIIHWGNQDTTTGTGGRIDSTNRYDVIIMECTVTNNEFTVVSSIGAATVT